MTHSAAPAPVLCAALVWGETVVALRHLMPGESLELGDGPGALAQKPLERELPDRPLCAVAAGWELDLRGATGGVLALGSRELDVLELAAEGRPVLVGPGDHGLVEFGAVALFFQHSRAAPALPRRRRWNTHLAWASLFSLTFTLGGLAILAGISPTGLARPLELTKDSELFRILRISSQSQRLPADGRTPSEALAAVRELGEPAPRHSRDDAAHREPAIATLADALQAEAGEDLRRALVAIPGLAAPAGQEAAVPLSSAAARSADLERESVESARQGLGTDEINEVVTTNLASFRTCYEVARVHNPKLAGAISVSFSVFPSGAVSGAAVATSSLRHKGVERCVLERFRTLRFPASNQRTNASFAFVFSPNDAR